MTMQNALKQVIKDTIAPLFKIEGFRKQGNNFAKVCSDFTATVNIQNSKWNTKEEVAFFFNTGIYTEKIFGTVFLFEKPSFPVEISSILRISGTELTTNNSWYRLNENTDLDQLTIRITEDIKEHIFPHFRQFSSIYDVISVMEIREKEGIHENPHYLTVLYHSIGNVEEAQERMIKVFRELRLDAQKDFARGLANRLGLHIS